LIYLIIDLFETFLLFSLFARNVNLEIKKMADEDNFEKGESGASLTVTK